MIELALTVIAVICFYKAGVSRGKSLVAQEAIDELEQLREEFDAISSAMRDVQARAEEHLP